MTSINFLVPIAVGAVFLVLLAGLWNMMRGGSSNTSQNLMRLRVLMQFVAILVILGVMYFATR
ncbi:MAG TPA: twin transmembrane helix small protein [Aestuariivirgaceae bacterium]|nr:twin transmembrane helix small protein [Aestuariivirgaceae bacterium]